MKLLKNGEEVARKERDATDGLGHSCYTFTPNGRFAVSGGGNGVLTLYSVPDLKKTADFIGHEGMVWAVACSSDGRYLVSGAADQTVRLWDLRLAEKGGEVSPLLTLFPAKDGKEWLAWTPEGYYTASEGAERFVGYQINRGIDKTPDFISSEQLEQVFFRPDLVTAKIRGGSMGAYPDVTSFLARKHAPAVRILEPADASTVNGDTVALRYSVEDRGSGVGSVRIYLNGTAVETGGTRGIKRKKKQTDIRELTLALEPGRDNLSGIVAWDAEDELKSEEAAVHVYSKSAIRKPVFHALVVGINQFANPDIALRFAAPDAEALAGVLKSGATRKYFKSANVTLLIDEDATLSKIVAELDRLKKQARPEDVVVIYMASHGEIRDSRYFLLTAATDYLMTEDLETTCLLEEDLRNHLSEIPAGKKLLLLDTCKSGKMVLAMNRGLTESTTLELLARAVGTYVMAAATEAQYASEGYNGHGLFSYVLIEGLKGGADFDQNGVVEVDELKLYVKREVPVLSQKRFGRRQLPTATGRGESFPVAGQ